MSCRVRGAHWQLFASLAAGRFGTSDESPASCELCKTVGITDFIDISAFGQHFASDRQTDGAHNYCFHFGAMNRTPFLVVKT